jgi:AraC family transcriptional regulator, transcriptional activator of pobA
MSSGCSNHKNAAERITALFFAQLDQQFPITSTGRPMETKTAQGFAKRLFVHVNHLNRSIKAVTGRPTSAHIAERLLAEAQNLLQYTDWNINEIAGVLGFEYPAHFNNFYKNRTGTTPTAFRAAMREKQV